MANFTAIVSRLDGLRQSLAATLLAKGIDASSGDTLAMLVDKAALIDSTSGMNQIRNGYQLFRNNTTMVAFPEFATASFDSMYQMCYGCTKLESVPVLDTPQVRNMMYIFYGCTNLVEIGGLNTSLLTSASEMFHGCRSLRRIGGTLRNLPLVLCREVDTRFRVAPGKFADIPASRQEGSGKQCRSRIFHPFSTFHLPGTDLIHLRCVSTAPLTSTVKTRRFPPGEVWI